jgi:Dipeptidase
MCDTVYAGPSACLGGREWLGKNSDRNPAEPQSLCIVPAAKGRDRRLAFALSKPSWMEGGEMGVNERGVAIGNEAVFSRFGAKKDGVLGMAILRMALERSETAAAARDFIADFVSRNDQGGNGAYKGSLVYSNSFLVSGPDGAFVIETAGRRWAWKRAAPIASISNAYSIESDYEGMDERSAAELHGSARGSWRELVEERFHLLFTRGDQRRGCTSRILESASPAVDFDAVASALRSHARLGRSMAGPCLHGAGFPVKSSTTASLMFERAAGGSSSGILWFTGRSHPCLSVFVPILLSEGAFVPLWTDYDYAEGAKAGLERWESSRMKDASRGGAALSSDPEFVASRDRIQSRLAAATADALGDTSGSALARSRSEVKAAMAEWESR